MNKRIVGCGVLTLILTAVVARALVMTESRGSWPADWPKAMEPLRHHARTFEVATGIQENIYEITFSDRAEFEKVWPAVLSLKTPGAPLRLYRVGKLPEWWGFGEKEPDGLAMVRINAPDPDGDVEYPDGQKLKPSPPWPKELYGPNGELPEYVRAERTGGKIHWVAADLEKDEKNPATADFYRARVDIDLVVDGQVIDLNRIALPANTPIEDHRF
jgi:hypothetical protein